MGRVNESAHLNGIRTAALSSHFWIRHPTADTADTPAGDPIYCYDGVRATAIRKWKLRVTTVIILVAVPFGYISFVLLSAFIIAGRV